MPSWTDTEQAKHDLENDYRISKGMPTIEQELEKNRMQQEVFDELSSHPGKINSTRDVRRARKYIRFEKSLRSQENATGE